MNRQQHNDYNDEALYQEIMAELDSGAAEYDRLMASGDAPAKKSAPLPSHNKKEKVAVKWYAAAAAVAGLLIVSTIWFLGQDKNDSRHMASTETSIPKKEHLAAQHASTPQAENTDSDIYKLTAKMEGQQKSQPERKPQLAAAPTPYIYTAMLPEVEFCPKSDDDVRSNAVSSDNVRLPQVRKERSFALVCNVILPDITAYADSTIFTSGTELMVACDEISYNDSNF